MKNNTPQLFIRKKNDIDEEIGESIGRNDMWINIYVYISMIVIIGFFLLVIKGDYSEKSHVFGYLIPDKGVIKVMANHEGLVSTVNVTEGQKIKKNELLFVIDVNSVTEQGKVSDLISENLKTRRELLCKELDRLGLIHLTQSENVNNLINSYRTQKDAIQKEIDAEREYIYLSQRNISRYKELGKKYFVSTSDIEKSQQELQTSIIQFNSLQRILASTSGNLDQQIQIKSSLEDKQNNEKSEIQREIVELDQEIINISQQQYLSVRASSSGLITQITAKLGVVADTSIPLATILPEGAELEANIYVPSSSVGFIKKNTDVLIAYQAYPYQKFGLQHAFVKEISKTAVNTRELPFDPHTTDPLYLIKAKLDKSTITAYGEEEMLQSGEKFDAYLVLEHRKIWEWAIAPLLAQKDKF